MNEKMNVPVAVCTVCHTYSRNVATINCQCGNKFNGKRCKGVWGSALNESDWEECPSCEATGNESNRECEQCEGFGWIYCRGN